MMLQTRKLDPLSSAICEKGERRGFSRRLGSVLPNTKDSRDTGLSRRHWAKENVAVFQQENPESVLFPMMGVVLETEQDRGNDGKATCFVNTPLKGHGPHQRDTGQ